MTNRRKICASLAMVAFFAIVSVAATFVTAGRSIASLAATQTAGFEDVTDEYGKYAYDTDQYGTSVKKLTDVAKESEYITMIASLDMPTLLDEAGETAVSEFAGTAKYNDAAKKIRSAQNSLLRALDKADIKYKVEARYNTVLSGVAVEVASADFAQAEAVVERMGGNAMVSELYYPSQVYRYETDAAEAASETGHAENSGATSVNVTVNEVKIDENTGIFDGTDSGYDGNGVVVSVIDSGFDYTHTAYTSAKAKPDKIVLDRDAVASKIKNLRALEVSPSLSVADVYLSDKIPYAYDYADMDADVYPLESEHGTHVASIIAGADDAITGVAPKAQLVLMKVFSDTSEGAKQSSILRAVEDSVTLGVDVINMSLGMDAGFAREDDTKRTGEVYDKVKNAGISLIAAASNSYNSTFGSEANGNLPLTSNPDSATVGSPSTYEAALSVASISGVKTPYMLYEGNPIYYLEAANSAGKSYNFVDTMLGEYESATFEYVTVPGVGDSYAGVDVRGKIALVRRGRTTFEDKVEKAYYAGARGVIVYNNVSGDIRMSVGNYLYDWNMACASMSQEDGEKLAAKSRGTIKLSRAYMAGPFMSDFSSWGPSPDLGIKPEITAHGGEIYAAVPGQRYDRLSGTSMASPNQAGVHALVRQYVKEHFASFRQNTDIESAEGRRAVATITNQLLMSTTDIARNNQGNPYSVRKQGSGLANVTKAVTTDCYITVKDGDGEELDRTKAELGDDPLKTGVYEIDFTVHNISNTASVFTADASVYTETVSATKTDKEETVSSEMAYMLSDTTVTVSGAGASGNRVTVQPHSSAQLKMTLTLSAAAKRYMDESFENGMYVEGFVLLRADGNGVSLNMPFLAFYGDWTQAPMFDLTYFETNPDEINNAIDDEDKIKPDAYATRPIGGFSSDFISFMGSYYFLQDPSLVQIPAQEEHIALTNTTEGINYIYGVWAGLLRSAKTMDVTLSDATTGRVIYRDQKVNQRKSRSYGAGIAMSAVDLKWHVNEDFNLKNNTQYTVKLEGHLDYERDGAAVYDESGNVTQEATNSKNTYEFTFTTDFEAPKLTDVRYYTEYDEDTHETKLYADIDVYDNHYAMALRVGTWNGRTLVGERYPTPIYSNRNATNTVTVELTDWMKYASEAHPADKIMIFAYDYAMNSAVYELSLPQDVQGLYLQEEEIVISRYETKELRPLVDPSEAFTSMLDYTSADESIAKVVDGTLVGIERGETTITVSSRTDDTVSQQVKVKVLGEGDDGFYRYDKPIVKSFSLTGFHTDFTYYEQYNEDRRIGEIDDEVKFAKGKSLELYPGEVVTLRWDLSAYFDTSVRFASGDENIVKVDPVTGTITALGSSRYDRDTTVSVEVEGTGGMYRDFVRITVKPPYESNGAYLAKYRGIGEDNAGHVVIPAKFYFVEISEFAFSLPESVDKEEEPTEEDPYYTTNGPVGEQRPMGTRIRSVVIPEGVEVIGRYAFAYMTELEEVYLPSTLRQINSNAFLGCTALRKVAGLENVKIISHYAFSGCSSLNNTLRFSVEGGEEFRLDEAIGLGAGAFEGTAIRSMELPKLQSAGAGAFRNCTSLKEVTFGSKIKIDSNIFAGCTALTDIEINAPVIADYAFADNINIENVTLGKDVAQIGTRAFAGTKVKSFTVSAENTHFYADDSAAFLFEDEGKTKLATVAPGVKLESGVLTLPDGVTYIGRGAFAAVDGLEGIVLSGDTAVEEQAFFGCKMLASVTGGNLTRVGNYAFYGTALSAMPALAPSCTTVGDYAFAELALEGELTLPSGIAIGEGTFAFCEGITAVTASGEAMIGNAAFMGCAALETVTLGGNTEIGDRAFYACETLGTLNFEYVTRIGASAFTAPNGARAAKFTDIDLRAATAVGEYAFAYLPALSTVTVSETLQEIGAYAFAYLPVLQAVEGTVNAEIGAYAFAGDEALTSFEVFERAASIGEYAFAGAGLNDIIELTNIMQEGKFAVGEYAFTGTSIIGVTLPQGAEIAEGVFAYAENLKVAGNLEKATSIGAFAFAGTSLSAVNLSSATYVGRLAFAQSKIVAVTLGNAIVDMGDNPFAGCALPLFKRNALTDDVFQTPYVSYDFDVSDTVHVRGGALYTDLPAGGMELICYPIAAGEISLTVEEGTVRVGDYAAAFEPSLTSVRLPYSLRSIGHMAFYGCRNLRVIDFGSIAAPMLEAEYDASYVQWDGTPGANTSNTTNAAQKIGLLRAKYAEPYITREQDVLFNANFVNYVGYVKGLTMTYPKNGTGYDAYVISQYFDTKIAAATVADDLTRRVIDAIAALPDRITLASANQVTEARRLYDQISHAEQAALVTNLTKLTDAERTIAALQPSGGTTTPTQPTEPSTTTPTATKENHTAVIVVLAVLAALLAAGCIALLVRWQLPAIRRRAALGRTKREARKQKKEK